MSQKNEEKLQKILELRQNLLELIAKKSPYLQRERHLEALKRKSAKKIKKRMKD